MQGLACARCALCQPYGIEQRNPRGMSDKAQQGAATQALLEKEAMVMSWGDVQCTPTHRW